MLKKYVSKQTDKHFAIKAMAFAAFAGLSFGAQIQNEAQAVEPTLGINSAYNLTAGTAEDYDFASIDKNGNAVYYKYALKNSDTPPDSQNVQWTKESSDDWSNPTFTLDPDTLNGEGSFSIQAIDKDGNITNKTFSYTYTNDGKNLGTLGELTGDAENVIYPENPIGVQNYSSENYNIDADFIQNNHEPTGGAIYNEGSLDNVSGTFINNHSYGNNTSYGGAISNYGEINTITGNFIQNNTEAGGSDGGAIYNTGDINKINANFVGNSAFSNGYQPGMINPKGCECGGAIKNDGGHIGSIDGNFYYNMYTSYAYDDLATGGAIANTGKVDSINANFVGNNLYGDYDAKGGAIHNANFTGAPIPITEPTEAPQNSEPAEITNISGSFIDNVAASWRFASGGAINNDGKIDTIEADFINNGAMAEGSNSYAKGGALFNSGEIKTVKGDFLNNIAVGSAADGGAIYNSNTGRIDNIFGNFLGNSAISNGSSGKLYEDCGGAIKNDGGYVGTVKGSFIDNHYSSQAKDVAAAGAYYNSGLTEKIEADFNNNTVTGYDAKGGGLYNFSNSTINEVKGDFIENGAKGYTAKGGAVYNNGTIGKLEGNFIRNYTETEFMDIPYDPGPKPVDCGGALYNDRNGQLDLVTGKFEGNRDSSIDNLATGGAISNHGVIKTINADFNGNYAQSEANAAAGGAIYNNVEGAVGIEALYAEYTIVDENNNVLGKVYDAAIYDEANDNFYPLTESEIKSGKYTFTQDYADTVTFEDFKNWFEGTSDCETIEDLIAATQDNEFPLITYNPSDYNYTSNDAGTKVNIVNSSFTNNYAKAANGEAYGGAIVTGTELNITAKDGYVSKISGNYVEDANGKRDEGIFVAAPVPLTLEAKTKGKIIVEDQINGIDGYTLAVKGDKTGVVEINNDVKAIKIQQTQGHESPEEESPQDTPQTSLTPGIANITLDKTMLHLARRDNVLDGNNLTLNSGTFNMINNQVGISALNNLTVNGNTNFVADVDLANSQMDRFTAKEYGQHKGKLNVVGMNLLSDATKDTTDIYFAEKGLKDHVVSKVGRIGRYTNNKYQTTAFAPIYRYDITYENRDDAGYFVFSKHVASGGEPVPIGVQFNPAVLASPAAAQAGAATTMNQALSFAFEHGDTFMNLSSMDRFAKTHENVYALSTDFDGNRNLDYSHENKSVWVKPYTVFENIKLKNGPKVDTISYGSLIGFDSNIHKLKRGWYNVGTAYIGYNGAQLKYSGVDTSLNGGLVGLTETFYKGNFWTALTATVGAAGAEANTMYGKEDMGVLMTGIGSKTGYNFEFADGKFIVQPRMFVAYSMINVFDYTNAAGVRIDSDPMHTIQLNPAIKLIGNSKNGWQPYASVGMMWNLLNETDVTANGIKLPEMHTRPYVEYGLGVQKLWNDKYSAYGQAMVRNGGKTGVALTFGFRMALGQDGKPIEKTQSEPKFSTITDKLGHLK